MIILETERLILRDMIKTDIDDRVYWETVDREWMNWDGPWETEGETPEQIQAGIPALVEAFSAFVERSARKAPEDLRYSFQIERKDTGKHIGWISCYCIDENYSYTEDDGLYAFGISLPPQECRGQGFGYEAFRAAMTYWSRKGLKQIYTQTWSGNLRMIALAKKLGFEEICRKKDLRLVRGQRYDGLTFVKDLSTMQEK